MATVTFRNLILDISHHVPGCPSEVMITAIRKVAIDLCDRAKVWRVFLTPVAVVAGTTTYALVSPVTQTEVSAVLSTQLSLTTAAITKDIRLVTGEQALRAFPDWPNAATPGEPNTLFQLDEQTIHCAPVPGTDDTYTLRPIAAIRPTMASTGMEDTVANKYRRVLFHGVLHELMLIPDRVWTDDKKSLYHGKQWTYLLNAARARASKGFSRADIQVTQRPWA